MSDCCDKNKSGETPLTTGFRSGAELCDDRFQSLPRSKRIRLFGADGKCLREFPSEARGFLTYDGQGGGIVTTRPVVPIPYRKTYAKDPDTGALILDTNGQPVEVTPPPANSLLVADADGAQNRWQGQSGVAQVLRWNGSSFEFEDEVFVEKDVWCDVEQAEDGDEAILVPFQYNQIINGVCVEKTCFRLARKNPSLLSAFDAYREQTDALIADLTDRLDNFRTESDMEVMTLVDVTQGQIPANSLSNRVNVVSGSWVLGHQSSGFASIQGGVVRFEEEGTYSFHFLATIGTSSTSFLYVRPNFNGAPNNNYEQAAFVRNAFTVSVISTAFSLDAAPGDTLFIEGGTTGSPVNIRLRKLLVTKIK